MEKLTQREQEALKLLCQGYSGTEIARILDISLHTAYIHSSRLHTKASFRFKELVALALSMGMNITPASCSGELTPRLEEVLECLTEAESERAAARGLCISMNTMAHDLGSIYQRLGIKGDKRYNPQHLAMATYLARQRLEA